MITYDNLFSFFKRKNYGWKQSEYFDEAWKERIYILSTLIKDTEQSILDLGCGKEWLREFIGENILYIPVDYVKRSERCIVCDFNKKEFPSISADVAFLSGVLEYIEDPVWFFAEIYKKCNSLIFSYCATNFYPQVKYRRSLNWVNDLNRNDILHLLENTGFVLSKEILSNKHLLFRFKKKVH